MLCTVPRKFCGTDLICSAARFSSLGQRGTEFYFEMRERTASSPSSSTRSGSTTASALSSLILPVCRGTNAPHIVQTGR
eukprot:2269390-Rhodomonas_salina.2